MEQEKINLKVCSIENKEYSREELKDLFNEYKTTISYQNYYKEEVKREFLFLEQNKEILIKNYPYGYKRTNIKYSVETTKRGGRFVSQTLNPKSQEWNKPKKSTYHAVAFLVADSTGKIGTLSLNYNDDESKVKVFYDLFKEHLNEQQKIEIAKITGYTETMKNVSFSVKVRRFKNTETGEIVESVPLMQMNKFKEVDENDKEINQEEEEQKEKETQDNINKSVNYNIHKFKQQEGF